MEFEESLNWLNSLALEILWNIFITFWMLLRCYVRCYIENPWEKREIKITSSSIHNLDPISTSSNIKLHYIDRNVLHAIETEENLAQTFPIKTQDGSLFKSQLSASLSSWLRRSASRHESWVSADGIGIIQRFPTYWLALIDNLSYRRVGSKGKGIDCHCL